MFLCVCSKINTGFQGSLTLSAYSCTIKHISSVSCVCMCPCHTFFKVYAANLGLLLWRAWRGSQKVLLCAATSHKPVWKSSFLNTATSSFQLLIKHFKWDNKSRKSDVAKCFVTSVQLDIFHSVRPLGSSAVPKCNV